MSILSSFFYISLRHVDVRRSWIERIYLKMYHHKIKRNNLEKILNAYVLIPTQMVFNALRNEMDTPVA